MSKELVEKCSQHDANNIKGFFGAYRWLSNYHMCEVEFEGDKYPSSENAYQAAKCCWADRSIFFNCSPTEAKKFGGQVKPPADWFSRNVDIMKKILWDKFNRNYDLQQMLIHTKDRYLEETNWWNDTFWGVCDGKGENMLGKLLMGIREDLQRS